MKDGNTDFNLILGCLKLSHQLARNEITNTVTIVVRLRWVSADHQTRESAISLISSGYTFSGCHLELVIGILWTTASVF